MAIIEYSAERHIQYEKEESYNSGYNSGYDSGYDSGITSGVKNTTELFSWLFKNGRAKDVEKATNDPDFLNQLFEEYSKNK